jgi:hypothetical protein
MLECTHCIIKHKHGMSICIQISNCLKLVLCNSNFEHDFVELVWRHRFKMSE